MEQKLKKRCNDNGVVYDSPDPYESDDATKARRAVLNRKIKSTKQNSWRSKKSGVKRQERLSLDAARKRAGREKLKKPEHHIEVRQEKLELDRTRKKESTKEKGWYFTKGAWSEEAKQNPRCHPTHCEGVSNSQW